MEKLKELFAVPIGLKPVISIDNVLLYGSDTLNKNFLISISKSNRGKIIYKTVERMIKNRDMIPCFADSGIFSYFKRRVSKGTKGGIYKVLRRIVSKKPISHPLDDVLAFYDKENEKIVVLINNHVYDSFVNISNVSIALSLTHEMIHMFAHQNPNKFISLFKTELNTYYLNYFKSIFDLKERKSLENVVENICKYLFFKNEITNQISLSGLYKELFKLKNFSKLESEEFDKICMDYVKVIDLLLTHDIIKFVSLVKKNYKYLIVPLYDSYKTSFGKIPAKGCSQELIFPSEVICGYSDIRVDTKIKTAFNELK